jgi:hypothetical protein
MTKPTATEIKANIQGQDSAVWNQASQRPDGLDRFEADLATAIATAWSEVVDGLVIASVPVTGGTSTPGGALMGGIATLAPGTLASTASFTGIADKFSSSFPDGATPGLLALVNAISQGIGQKFPLWASGYSAILTAIGGTCGWTPPAPPANPTGTPGPWAGGSIKDFPLAGGSSIGDQEMSASSLEAAIDLSADPSVLKQNQNTLQPALRELIKAISKGFETTWNQWKSNTKISGGTGAGTASPPGGSITTGAVTSPDIS